MRKSRHPLLRRLSCNPLLVAVLFAYLAYRTYAKGVGFLRLAGLGTIGLWLVLSVYDWFTSHSLLDAWYSDDDRALSNADVASEADGKLEEAIAVRYSVIASSRLPRRLRARPRL